MMLALLERVTRPPEFKNPDLARQAAMLDAILLGVAGAQLVSNLLLWLLERVPGRNSILLGMQYALCALLLRMLLRRGYLRLVIALFLCISLIFQVLVLINIGTLFTIHLAYFFVPVMVALLLLGIWPALGTLLVCAALILVLAQAENAGWLRATSPMHPFTQWLNFSWMAIFFALGSYLVKRSLTQAVEQARSELAERQRIESALRERERQFVTLVENAHDLIIRFDCDLRLRYVNPAAAQLLGGQPQPSYVGVSLIELLQSAELRNQFLPALEQALQLRMPTLFTVHSTTLEGLPIALQAQLTPEFDDHGTITGLLAFARDVTELYRTQIALQQLNQTLEQRVAERTAELLSMNQQLQQEINERRRAELALLASKERQQIDLNARSQAERQLQQSERRYRMLADLSPTGIFHQDTSGNCTYVNQRWCEISGLSPEEAAGQGWRRGIHPDDAAAISTLWWRSITLGQRFHAEFRFRRPDGGASWVLCLASAEFDADGHTIGYVGTITDITERRQVEEELRRAARLKDEFLASMSHELRTPLTSILGHTEILQEQIAGPLTATQLRMLLGIAESGQHLLALINDILDLAKIEARQMPLDRQQLPVAPVCESALYMVRRSAEQKSLSLSLQIAPEVHQIEADGRRLKQILVNLLSNAVKFTPVGGAVGLDVALDANQRMLCFCVWDTGIGISESDQRRLFQPFVQLDSSLTRKYEGTGLGLALVARLAALHGGHVSLSSTPGQGSRFRVCLPQIAAPAAAGSPADAPERAEPLPAVAVD